VEGEVVQSTGVVSVSRNAKSAFIRVLGTDEKLAWVSEHAGEKPSLAEGTEVSFEVRVRGGLRCALDVKQLPEGTLRKEELLDGFCTALVIDDMHVVLTDVSECALLAHKYVDLVKAVLSLGKGSAGKATVFAASAPTGPTPASPTKSSTSTPTESTAVDGKAGGSERKYFGTLLRVPIAMEVSKDKRGKERLVVGTLVRCRAVVDWALQRYPLRVCDVTPVESTPAQQFRRGTVIKVKLPLSLSSSSEHLFLHEVIEAVTDSSSFVPGEVTHFFLDSREGHGLSGGELRRGDVVQFMAIPGSKVAVAVSYLGTGAAALTPPPPPAAAASKTIDDLFKKTVAKPSIYWAPKEKYLTQTQIIENIVAGLVDSIVASMETVKQVETTINESHSNENETTKKAFALNLSDLISNNIKTHEININCFDNGTLIAVYYENKQVVCSIIDKDKLEIKNSLKIPVLNSEINLNLRKYKNLIYLSFNTPNGSVIKIVDDHLNMLDEIIFSQGVSRLLGINDLFIFFKPELSNIKLESRIYIYDRKLKTKKAVGQCNSPLRPFFFSKSTVQLESLNNKFICLDSDDTFKIIDELSGIVLYSIRLKEAKQFLLSSQQEIILLTDKTLTYFTLDGYLDKQKTLDDKLFEELICFFNDCHDNIYLFERNQFILHKF